MAENEDLDKDEVAADSLEGMADIRTVVVGDRMHAVVEDMVDSRTALSGGSMGWYLYALVESGPAQVPQLLLVDRSQHQGHEFSVIL